MVRFLGLSKRSTLKYIATAKAIHYHLLMKRAPLVAAILLLLCVSANAQTDRPDPGVVKDGVYTNTFFRFSYEFPKGWVVHGEATNERIREIGKERTSNSGAVSEESLEVAMKNTYHLLTVFRQPVGTPGIGFNPGVLVIAERVAFAPGITNGKDYLLSMRGLMLKTGAQSLLKEPTEHRFGGLPFFRDDYAVEINPFHVKQIYIAHVVKGYSLVFIFISDDQKSLDEMTKTMDTFMLRAMPPVRKGVGTGTGAAPERKPN